MRCRNLHVIIGLCVMPSRSPVALSTPFIIHLLFIINTNRRFCGHDTNNTMIISPNGIHPLYSRILIYNEHMDTARLSFLLINYSEYFH